jgi:uncharacterized RDD family membrane protein YckC
MGQNLNTMRSAQFQLVDPETPLLDAELQAERDPHSLLKQQVAERLAAHRSRKGRTSAPASIAPAKSPAHGRANRIAAAVAERYAQSPSYREFLAAEARRAIEEADAAAEVAARNAAAINLAQQQLLEDLESWNTPAEPWLVPPPAPEPRHEYLANLDTAASYATEPRNAIAPAYIQEPGDLAFPDDPAFPSVDLPVAARTTIAAGPLTVRHYEDTPVLRAPQAAPTATPATSAAEEEERWALDDEIAFRLAPGFLEPHTPPVALPANLIEFPRQLVAPRKSRPRHAEGPLREKADTAPSAAQLRIFEVEANQISSTPLAASAEFVESAIPEWSSIHLDPTPAVDPGAHEAAALFTPPQTAHVSLRLMAATVDACLIGAAFFAFVAAAAVTTSELPTGLNAVTAAAGTILLLFLFYRTLFFTFSDATPGMRYARIGLCTFSDDNPTRSAMRRRTWAILLSAASLGIGCLWALLDDDRLSWHDRISRMYQRSY